MKSVVPGDMTNLDYHDAMLYKSLHDKELVEVHKFHVKELENKDLD